jgi:hypothetical protein
MWLLLYFKGYVAGLNCPESMIFTLDIGIFASFCHFVARLINRPTLV